MELLLALAVSCGLDESGGRNLLKFAALVIATSFLALLTILLSSDMQSFVLTGTGFLTLETALVYWLDSPD